MSQSFQNYEIAKAFEVCIKNCYHNAKASLEKAELFLKMAKQIECEPYQLYNIEPLEYINEMINRGSMDKPEKINNDTQITSLELLDLLDGQEELKNELKDTLESLYC
jgi:hypothetical protein